MPRYRFEFFDEPDDENTHELDRLGGRPRGIKTGDWPRCRGVPMQHLIAVDLGKRAIDAPAAAAARTVSVFVDSYLETDFHDPEAIAVRFVDQASIDTVGETDPPDDFVEEPWSDDAYQSFSIHEDTEDVGDECTLGGEAVWPEETGEPEASPGGAFVMRITSGEVRLSREGAMLMVFEEGAVLVPEYDPDEHCCQVPWRNALAQTRELIVSDQPAEPGAIVKYGGVPQGIERWPTDARDRPLTHLMTLPIELLRDDDDDAVGVAFFIDRRRVGLAEWDREPDFFELEWIARSDDDDDDEWELEIPEGAEHLPERALELRPIAEATNWRQLLGKSFVGPRGVFHNPGADAADPGGHEVQLEASFLPGVSREGTLYLAGGSAAFQKPGDTGRGNEYDEMGFDDFGFDPYEDEGGEEGDGEAELSAGMRVLRRGSGPADDARSRAGGLPPDIGLEAWPRFEGELMTHILTIAFDDVPDLAGRGAAGVSVFLLTAGHHQAFSPDSDHAAVVVVTAEQLASRATKPRGEVLEVLDEVPLELAEHDGDSPPWSFAGGSPRWIQSPQFSGPFVGQFVEDLIDVNLGDSGALYIFGDTAFMQCC